MLSTTTSTITAHPWPSAAAAVGVLVLLAVAVRNIAKPSASVAAASVGALVCTAYSADTSWRFAEHQLGMHSTAERAAMFAAAEIALLSCGLLGRATKNATSSDTTTGTAGPAGALVWLLTGVQIIPAFTESGLWGGIVRAIVGPIMAGILWHLAMGLEIRLGRPGALSSGLLAQVARELRERLLASLGLAVRDRSAEQIARDRATVRAVRLAALLELNPTGRRANRRRTRLAAAVARSHTATDEQQRHTLMRQLAARRSAGELATMALRPVWIEDVPAEPYPRTPLGVTGAELRRLHPIEAVRQVQAAHPSGTPAEVAALCTGYGVPVSQTQVRIALRDRNAPVPPGPSALGRLVPEPVPETPEAEPVPAPRGLRLELAPMQPVNPNRPVPSLPAEHVRAEVHAHVPESDNGELLAQARRVDAECLAETGRPASIRVLKSALSIGQDKATEVRAELNQENP